MEKLIILLIFDYFTDFYSDYFADGWQKAR